VDWVAASCAKSRTPTATANPDYRDDAVGTAQSLRRVREGSVGCVPLSVECPRGPVADGAWLARAPRGTQGPSPSPCSASAAVVGRARLACMGAAGLP
jgi:hypothetical protein